MKNHAKHVTIIVVGNFDQNCQFRVEERRCKIHVFGPIKNIDFKNFKTETFYHFFIGTQCDYALRKVGNLAARYYGLALPKGSPNKAILSEKILELNDKGILQSLKTKWWPSCPSKATEKEAETQIGNFDDFFS